MDPRGNLHCPRCDATVRAIWPWRGWPASWVAWRIGLGIALLCFPLIAADYCIMLPSFMLYLASGGPIRAHAHTPPVCSRCSLELDPTLLSPAPQRS